MTFSPEFFGRVRENKATLQEFGTFMRYLRLSKSRERGHALGYLLLAACIDARIDKRFLRIINDAVADALINSLAEIEG